MRKTILAAVAAVLVVSCAEEAQLDKTQQKVPLLLEAVGQPAITRAATDIQSTTFDEGALIDAYISVTGATDGTTSLGNPKVMKAAAAVDGINSLSANDGNTLYFPPGDVNVSIYAHYPPSAAQLTPFVVKTPQTTSDDYKSSDLMYAKATTGKTDQPVHLQFDHKMAKLIVNATGEDGLTIKKITIKSLYTSINWTPATGNLGTEASDLKERKDIVIADGADYASELSGTALFPPQTKDDTYFIEVEAKSATGFEGIAYFYVCTKEFESGKAYTINMKIGPKNLQEDPNELVKDRIVVIEPWPPTVGTINVQAVGNLGLKIESLTDDKKSTTNTMLGTGLEGYFVYNGKDCTPVPTVTDGKETGATTLSDGSGGKAADYEVKYYNNQNAGTALIVVTGKGVYEGLSTFTTFTIKKAANTMHYPGSEAEPNLSRDAKVDFPLTKPNLKTSGAEVYGKMTFKLYSDAAMTQEYTSTDPIASVDENGNVFMKKKGGPIWVKATMDDTGNFEAATVSYKLTITQGDVAKSTSITIEWVDGKEDGKETWPFTGSAIRPGFSLKDNGNSMAGHETSGGIDYNYTYSDNIVAGQNTAVVTITGQGEYSGTKKFYFTITKVPNEWVTLNQPTVPIDCGTTVSNPQGIAGGVGTLSLPAGTFAIAGKPKFGSGTNYAGLTSNVSYSVTEGAAYASVDASTGVITGKAAGTAKIKATVAGTTNYDALETTITVTVEQMSYIYVYNGTTELKGNSYYQVRDASAQTFTKKFSANATLTAVLVGAGGGNDGAPGRGGVGGLVAAKRNFTKGTSVTWYAFCGGGGQTSSTGNDSGTYPDCLGGWPGGARAGTTGSSGAGGGATALCTTNSTNDWTFDSKDSRMLVAGAGGGSSNGGNGGEPAGPQAASEGNNPGSMITYTGTARKKWEGGRAYVADEVYAESPTQDGGSGGAGYYGGLGGAEQNTGNTVAAGGHGGSNYIKTSEWTHLNNETAGTEIDQGDAGKVYHTTSIEGFPVAIAYNGHKVSESGDALKRVWPGYIMIRYTY